MLTITLSQILLLISLAHAYRAYTINGEEKFRFKLAITATVIYFFAGWLMSLSTFFILIGCIIAIVGPIVGLTHIVNSKKLDVDIFQILIGFPQIVAFIMAVTIMVQILI